MTVMRRVLATAMIIFLLGATGARSEMSADEFLKVIKTSPEDKKIGLVYLDGQASGMNWYNAIIARNGKSPLYCPIPKVKFTPEQYADILQRFIQKNPKWGDQGVGFAMLFALIDATPCNAAK